MDNSSYDELSFLHFNDVYHITQSAALCRLSHVLRKAKDAPEAERPITVFSGDAFSPSLESAVLKGEHMVPVLNHLLVDVACYGNHDFDFGEETLVKLSRACTFPWLLANAVHADGTLLAMAKEILVLEKQGYRIGLFGLAGTDWPSNCQHLPADCTILDPVPVARRLSETLRSTYSADVVIAITHMRLEEDLRLVHACKDEVDLILGGHDHDLSVHGTDLKATDDATFKGHVTLVKSGTDFTSFSAIKVHLTRKNGKASLASIAVTQTRNITVMDDVGEECGMHAILDAVQTRIANAVDMPLFHSATPLEGRSSVVRTEETNLGNMLADAVRAYYDTDVAFINSGSVRCDRVVDAGTVTVKDMIDVLPFDNPFVVKRIPGHVLRHALENAACDIVDGRFFQVSGIAFHIDPQAPVGARVHGVSLTRTPRLGQAHVRARVHDGDGDGDGDQDDPDPDPDSPHAPRATRGTTGTSAPSPPVDPGPRDASPSDGSPSTPASARDVLLDAGASVRSSQTPLHDHATYTVALAAFIAAGYDGYDVFKDAPTLVDQDAEGGLTDSSLFLHVLSRRDRRESGPRGQIHGVERARAAIVLGTTAGGLPVVSPSVQGRIQHVGRSIAPA